jgi:DNA mismatch repair protein MutS2
MFDYDSVEFNTYIDFIKKSVNSPFSKELLNELKVENSLNVISNRQKILKEAICYIKNNKLPLFNDDKIFAIYIKIKEHHFLLTNIEFLAIRDFLKYIKSLKNTFKDEKDFAELSKLVHLLGTFDNFCSDLDRIFDDDGYIKDTANDNIYRIRKKLYRLRKEIYGALNKVIYSENSRFFITDNVITERYNRYLVLCKSNFRNYLEGLVHDMSISGQTYYVEPIGVVELNNNYRECKIEEEEEIRRIIEELNNQFKENK